MKLLTFITLLLLGTSAWAATNRTIAGFSGKTTGGVAFAFNKLGERRKLTPNTPIFEGETLITSKKAKSSLIFLDGTSVELDPSTQFRVDEFSYGKNVKKSSGIFSMLKGGFRFVSGLVNKKGGNLSFRTATATIGVRGSAGYFGQDGTIEVYEGNFQVAPSSGGQPITVSQGESTNTNGPELKTVKITRQDVQDKLDSLKKKREETSLQVVQTVDLTMFIVEDVEDVEVSRNEFKQQLIESFLSAMGKDMVFFKSTDTNQNVDQDQDQDQDQDKDDRTEEQKNLDQQIEQLESILLLGTGGGNPCAEDASPAKVCN